MARGELLRKLFISHRRGNEEEFRSAALEVIAEEERKNNHSLARDLIRILDNGGLVLGDASVGAGHTASLPKDREKQTLLVDVRSPDRKIDEIVLNAKSRTSIARILAEYRRSELLHVHGLKPRTRLLFCGPPGCGKTMCAEIIASELGLPLLYTRFDAIVSSYLGETAANLRKVFDYAARGRWVVLFDEFDAIGKSRDDVSEHGELKRVINSFLQLLDSFSSPSIVIAATNHEQLLDSALWRRFDDVVAFPRPVVGEIENMLARKLRNFPLVGVGIRATATKLRGMSHADVERICYDAIKSAILDDVEAVNQSILDAEIDKHRARLRISKSGSRSKRR